jgi:CDP-diacylglycerol--glycerol-3-phosphate 3-phosphatidyltransferase
MNLPNGLTLMRIFLVPLLVAVLLTKYNVLIAALIFLAASLTDLLDGYYARKRGQVTTLGILLDPVADKLLISSAFISLVQLQVVPAWMVVIIIGREFAVSGLRSIAAAQGFTIDASELGKIKMATQVAAITLLILGMPGGSPYRIVLCSAFCLMVRRQLFPDVLDQDRRSVQSPGTPSPHFAAETAASSYPNSRCTNSLKAINSSFF